jgi:FlaA1/EpsC-like NDP-sugar epimerase
MVQEKREGFIKQLLNPTMFKRKLFFLAADAALITGSVYLAFWLRFDGAIPENYSVNLKFYIAIALAVKLSSLLVHDMYDVSWRFFGLKDLIKLFSAITLSSIVLGLGTLLIKASPYFPTLPRSVVLVDYLLTLGSIGVLRISKRAVIEYLNKAGRMRQGRSKVLIVGAGDAGSAIGRDMLISKRSKFFPVGYVDDNPSKKGMSIHGIKVLGTRHQIPALLKAITVDEVLIAIPSVRSEDIRAVMGIIREAGGPVKVKILPGILDLVDGNVTLADIKESGSRICWAVKRSRSITPPSGSS